MNGGAPACGEARPRRTGLTQLELLVVMVVGALAASVLVVASRGLWERALKVDCAANLNEIYRGAARSVAPRRGVPHSAYRAHEVLQRLIDRAPDDWRPEIFVCPASEAATAARGSDGRFVLDAASNAYAWGVSKSTAKNRPLASDKFVDGYEDDDGVHCGHARGMNVLGTDGSIAFWSREMLNAAGLPGGLTR